MSATRNPTGERYDLLVPEFIAAMARIMQVGAERYGECNWKKGLEGDKSGINHAYAHLNQYQRNLPNDYGPRELHLAQVAVNAMFEFWFEVQRQRAAADKLKTHTCNKSK